MDDFFGELAKGVAGRPGLVRTPGKLSLQRGVSRRKKMLGRGALYAKANSNHGEHGHFSSPDDNGKREAPKATAERVRAAGSSIGSFAGTAGGEALGRVAGATLGSVGGPLGSVAGGVLGGVAGDYIGRKIAQVIARQIDPDLKDTPPGGAEIGGVIGSAAGSTTAAQMAQRFLSATAAPKAKLAAQVLGSSWGSIAGTKFGDYVASRIGDSVASQREQLATRLGKGLPNAGNLFARAGSSGDTSTLRAAPQEAMFRQLLDRADTDSRLAALRQALRTGVPAANLQPRAGEPYAAYHARLHAVAREQSAQRPVTMTKDFGAGDAHAGGQLKIVPPNSRRRVRKAGPADEPRDGQGRWSAAGTGAGAGAVAGAVIGAHAGLKAGIPVGRFVGRTAGSVAGRAAGIGAAGNVLGRGLFTRSAWRIASGLPGYGARAGAVVGGRYGALLAGGALGLGGLIAGATGGAATGAVAGSLFGKSA